MKNTITEKDLSQNWNFIVYTYLHRKAIIYHFSRRRRPPLSEAQVGDEFGTDNFCFCLDYIVILFTI